MSSSRQRPYSIKTRIKTLRVFIITNVFRCIVRDHIPSKQGLRLRLTDHSSLAIPSQRPYSIKTRIKTLIPSSSLTLVALGQRPYSIKTRIKTRLPALPAALQLNCQRPYSIKTRIKTCNNASDISFKSASETIFHQNKD